jgi:hypothetical protein
MKLLAFLISLVFSTAALASNCPLTPPPEAVAAGFTTLVKCWDGGDPYYGNIQNWLDYGQSVPPTHPEWFGVMTNSGNTTPIPSVITQTTDPVDGKTVLDLHWPGGVPGYLQMTTNGGSRGNVEYPMGGLVEIQTRLTPRQTSGGSYPGPSFSTWHQYAGPFPSTDGPAPLEDDIYEWYSGLHMDIAEHDWGQYWQTSAIASGTAGRYTINLTDVAGMPITQGASKLPITPQCISGPPYPNAAFNPNQYYYLWAYNPSTGNATFSSNEGTMDYAGKLIANLPPTQIYLNSCSDGWYPGDLEIGTDVTVMHTYGMLTATDGSTFIQKCGFLDHNLIANPQNKPDHVNCGEYEFSRETFHYTEPKEFRWWIGTSGAAPTDQYVRYIAVWGRPDCLPAGTDPTCAGPGLTPSQVMIQR